MRKEEEMEAREKRTHTVLISRFSLIQLHTHSMCTHVPHVHNILNTQKKEVSYSLISSLSSPRLLMISHW